MIILIVGGIGSGKSVSAIKEIIDKKQYALTNFKVKNMKNSHRIKFSDIISETERKDEGGRNKTSRIPKKHYGVNWDFWEDIRKNHKNFSIYLDEIHNIIHSRRAMSRRNILMSKWVSQIRKILSDNPHNHLYCISQTVRKVDIDFRDLAQIVVYCEKVKIRDKVYIVQSWYNGISKYMVGRRSLRTKFLANKYFKYYDTTEMVTFADAEEYI